MSFINNVGAEIRKERVRQGLTQEELANKVHTSRTNISRIENGRINPTLKTVEDIAVGVTGHEPRLVISDKERADNPFGQSYTTFEINNIKPFTPKESIIVPELSYEDFMNILNSGKTASDIYARINFWEIIIASGVLDSPCDGIELIVTVNEPKADSETFEKFIGSVTSGMLIIKESRDVRFGAVDGWSVINAISSVKVDIETGKANIAFSDSFNELDKTPKELITEILDRDRAKIKEATKFVEDHPNGFTYICYEWPLEYNEYDNGPLHVSLINAWTEEDAKKSYLMIDRKQRLFEFYKNDFSDVFAKSALLDEILYDADKFRNGIKLRKLAEDAIEGLVPTNGSFTIDDKKEKEIIEIIKQKYTKEELYEAFGSDDFETFWFDYAVCDVDAQLSEEQSDIAEYVYSVLAYDFI